MLCRPLLARVVGCGERGLAVVDSLCVIGRLAMVVFCFAHRLSYLANVLKSKCAKEQKR